MSPQVEGGRDDVRYHLNAIKNALAKDIPGYLAKATYLGWRPVAEGKHYESAYFAYFSRELGCRTILCMRKMGLSGFSWLAGAANQE